MAGWTGKSDEYLNVDIHNDGFYPDLILGDFQRDYRIPSEFYQDTVTVHIELAMVEVNQELLQAKMEWTLRGAKQLSEVVGVVMDSENVLVMYYKRAVFCRAKALLLPQFATMTRTPNAEHAAIESEHNEAHWFNESQRWVRKILDKPGSYSMHLL
ncbi:head completion/stabilization protein [Marinibactrum halimedae]|uniref:Uncharacterized protein n=1 Tax=Marinibactrum halimedae TaxID=1444977 RepID=A0AA37WM85_9GAMM|nr:head completion/stabilization protein [Marinibactrum halimedae]MCD9458466.1 head completion/stabilization protein [Marinibactrum halimedae]GLS26163.1 hypothetical protein GCM10007877_18780 [Marinibactrum halimedae]